MATLLCVHIAYRYKLSYKVKNITYSYKEKKYIKYIMSYLPQDVSLGILVGNFLKVDCLYVHLGYRKMTHSNNACLSSKTLLLYLCFMLRWSAI